VVNKLDCRRIFWTARSTTAVVAAKFFKVQSWDKVPRESAIIFGGNRVSLHGKKHPCQNPLDLSSCFDAIGLSTCDGQTDRQTHDDTIYRATIALRCAVQTVLTDRFVTFCWWYAMQCYRYFYHFYPHDAILALCYHDASNPQALPSTSSVDSTIDLPWRNFLCPNLETKREVPLFLRYQNFLIPLHSVP